MLTWKGREFLRVALLVIALSAGVAGVNPAASTPSASEQQSAIPADLDSYIAGVLRTFDVPGIAVAIVKDGKVVLAKGYGVKSILTNEKVDANTLYGIASNSKAFTTAALAILVDEGKLKWDDKVITYLPNFKMYNDYVTNEFTIRD